MFSFQPDSGLYKTDEWSQSEDGNDYQHKTNRVKSAEKDWSELSKRGCSTNTGNNQNTYWYRYRKRGQQHSSCVSIISSFFMGFLI